MGDSLADNIFIDHCSLFDDGRGVVAVFYRHPIFDGDIFFKINIAFDAERFTVDQ